MKRTETIAPPKNRENIELSFSNLEVKIGGTNTITKKFSAEKVILSGASGSIKAGTVS